MIRIQADALRRVIADIFHRAGSNETEAAAVARRLVDANLVGHDSHGVKSSSPTMPPGSRRSTIESTPTSSGVPESRNSRENGP